MMDLVPGGMLPTGIKWSFTAYFKKASISHPITRDAVGSNPMHDTYIFMQEKNHMTCDFAVGLLVGFLKKESLSFG